MVLKIETKKKLIKINNPQKARFADRIFWDTFQIFDNDGKWNTIYHYNVWINLQKLIVEKVNLAIKNKKDSIYLEI